MLVVGSEASPVTDQVYEDIHAVLASKVSDDSLILANAAAGLSPQEVLANPTGSLRTATISIRSAEEAFVLVKAMPAPPAPSFDALGWNLDLAANADLVVVYALDGAGMSADLLSQDIASFLARAATHHATVAGVVVQGARGLDVESAVPVIHSPVDEPGLDTLMDTQSAALTPIGFQADLLKRAASYRKRIVLPESEDRRILTATEELLVQGVADVILLGDKDTVLANAEKWGLNIEGARIVATSDAELAPKYAAELQRLRAAKGMTLEQAQELVATPTYFATMMVQMGDADGMVSGATHTTADTFRPAFQIIKTAPGAGLVSSAFLMLMPDEVLMFADCAVVVSPNAEQLSQIATTSAQTARQFGIDPKVAMLSYSTLGSGAGPSVEVVTEATELVKKAAPDLPVEGPIQYDAAVDPTVGLQKAPGSSVAGQATVLVFPDLNAGNIAYKAVQRGAGAVAVGPILQGLRKPVNDLSRGALVEDIVNTVAITAVQAGADS